MILHKYPHLTIKKSPISGYGVFATEDIPPNTLLEMCHHLPIKKDDLGDLLRDYRFYTNKELTHFSIVLGYGSLYNSSEDPNAKWELPLSFDHPFIFLSIKPIKKGEEILINYHFSLSQT